MQLSHTNDISDVFGALSSYKRVVTFAGLANGTAPKQIAEELDLTRSAIQPYLNDFKDFGLVNIEGKTYTLTEKGQQTAELLELFDQNLTEEPPVSQLLEEKLSPEEFATLEEEIDLETLDRMFSPPIPRELSQTTTLEIGDKIIYIYRDERGTQTHVQERDEFGAGPPPDIGSRFP